jgi:hypothetical protein
MQKKLLRICPYYHKTCQEVNEELEKQGRVCHHLTVMQQTTPQGTMNLKICVVEASALVLSEVSSKLGSMLTGGHKDLPKLYLPGAN